jgi:hypothetical protein
MKKIKQYLLNTSILLSVLMIFGAPVNAEEVNSLSNAASAELLAVSLPPTDHSFLLGTWVNVDKATNNIRAFVIKYDTAGELTVRAYGACSPTACDWGAVSALPYATSVSSNLAEGFTAPYDHGFSETILTGTHLVARQYADYDLMTVNSFTKFNDGSNRSSYYATNYFVKVKQAI